MKKNTKIFWTVVSALLLVLACTKEVTLFTEVEFSLLEQRTSQGFVNQQLQTTLTVVPEAELEGYTYSFTYEILQGNGRFENADGAVLNSGNAIPFSPFSASVNYVGQEAGIHRVRIVGSDNFGFTEELEITYDLEEIPVTWAATSASNQIQLGQDAVINLTFATPENNTGTTYEAAYQLSGGNASITAVPTDGYAPTTNFEPIAQGTYQLNLSDTELGTLEIVFLLRDNNGDDFETALVFEIVTVVEVVSLSLGECETLTMIVGETTSCPVTFTPSNTTDQGVTWSSDNPGIVAVDGQGVFTAIAAGSATVTVTATSNPTITTSVTITVSDEAEIPVTGITVAQEDPSDNDAIRQLIATVLPTNASNTNVTWSSEDTSIATVDANGLLTGVAAGTVTITATSVSDPEISGSIEVVISGSPEPNGTDITAFSLPSQNDSDIDAVNHEVTVSVPQGTNLNVAPNTLSLSPGASVAPDASEVRNFNNPITYTVTAANGDQEVWTVNVTEAASSEKTITSFVIDDVAGTITGFDIAITLPSGTDVTALSPNVVHTGVSLSPESGTSQDFSTPRAYTVTAQDGSTRGYLVTVTLEAATNQAPTAIASSDVTSGPASLTVDFTGDQSSDPDAGDTLSYLWNFDDNGNSSVSANPQYTFNTPGTYNVVLTVTDNGNPQLSNSQQLTITVSTGAALDAINDEYTFLTVDQETTFDLFVLNNDIDPGADGTPRVYVTSYTQPSSGSVLLEPSTLGLLRYTIDAATPVGIYTFEYSIEDVDGGTDTAMVTITLTAANQNPTARPESVLSITDGAPDTLNFTGVNSFDDDPGDTIEEYRWDFGDPGSGIDNTFVSDSPTASHEYVTAGSYTVTLTVVDNRGGVSDPVALTVTVSPPNTGPTAVNDDYEFNTVGGQDTFTLNVTSNDNDPDNDPLTVTTFTQPSSGTIARQSPGSNVLEFTINPSFDSPGFYSFSYTITDGNATSTATVEVTLVTECPTGQQLCFGPNGPECRPLTDPNGSPLICPN